MKRVNMATAIGAGLAMLAVTALVNPAQAGPFRRGNRGQAHATMRTPAANSGSTSGWNSSNTWYNHPSYGNYAPPPYATSRSAFIQVGPVPAPGGVRSLQGWGGAR